MSRAAKANSNFLRAGFLVLLVLGLVIKPALSHITELHTVEHAALADADGHGHAHDGDHDDGEPAQDHVKGAHGLMHQANMGAFSDALPTLALQPRHLYASTLPIPDSPAAPRQFVATPFRPPIA